MSDAPLARLTTALADHYRLEHELGVGGMATVYLAEDLKHDRKVAIKLLRPELSAILGGERFLNEIRVTAHLQHPHILPVYDSGSVDELLYYVMPYVEGESLRDRLLREKQLPIEEAITITRAVASALDYAHRHHVIHRDVKPENILLAEGQALVADFGIAIAVSAAGGRRLTDTGVSLGTPHYMSPEQATGDRQLDGRSDTYSLGCVAYEMLTGDPPHTGSTAQAVIAKIVTEQPSRLSHARPIVPPHVEAAIHKALEKLPADRFHSVAEFAEALGHAGALLAPPTVASLPLLATVTRGKRVWVAAVGVVLLGLGAVLGRVLSGAGPHEKVARFSLLVDEESRPVFLSMPTLAVSPDGSVLLYVGSDPFSGARLYARRLEALTAELIPGTEGAITPFFSPDGHWIGFITGGQLKRVPVSGGAPELVADSASVAAGATWTTRNEIVFGRDGALFRVAATGGKPQLVATPDKSAGESALGFPDALPDGRHVLVTARTPSASRGVFLLSLESGERRPLLPVGTLAARFSPSGHLVYALESGTLLAVPFRGGRVSGGAVTTIADHVQTTSNGIAKFALSWNGSLLYIPEEPFQLARVDRHGGARPVVSVQRYFHSPRVSPEGRRVAVDFTWQGARDVWVQDMQVGTLSRATFDRDGHDPYWSPDGRHITYLTARSGQQGLWLANADGSGAPESLLAGAAGATAGAWTPDRRQIVTSDGVNLWVVPMSGQRRPTPLLATSFAEAYPAISPDGRWLAYASDETGRNEVYVHALAGGDSRWQVSTEGGTEPVWAKNGHELFYRSAGGNGARAAMMAIIVRTSPTFGIVSRTPLFDVGDYEPSAQHANYDALPGDGGFVMVRHTRAAQLVLVQHWDKELRDAK